MRKTFSKFVCFSESPNFNLIHSVEWADGQDLDLFFEKPKVAVFIVIQLFKKNLRPVHLLTQPNKWDYLQGPIIKKDSVSCLEFGVVPWSPRKLNWHQLSFLPFIFIFKQCVWSSNWNSLMNTHSYANLGKSLQRKFQPSKWKLPTNMQLRIKKFMDILAWVNS